MVVKSMMAPLGFEEIFLDGLGRLFRGTPGCSGRACWLPDRAVPAGCSQKAVPAGGTGNYPVRFVGKKGETIFTGRIGLLAFTVPPVSTVPPSPTTCCPRLPQLTVEW
jgi:hypothetical protein